MERSKSEVAVSHIGHVTHSRDTVRSAVVNVINYGRDKCLVCGKCHNNGNLPCPTMQVIAHVKVS